MAIGFPAKYTIQKEHALKNFQALADVVNEAFTALGWKNLKEDQERGQIIAQIPATGSLTLGELCKVQYTSTHFILESRCILFTQFVDFGKNKRNIKSLLSIVNQSIDV